jgi:hypothetical protein
MPACFHAYPDRNSSTLKLTIEAFSFSAMLQTPFCKLTSFRIHTCYLLKLGVKIYSYNDHCSAPFSRARWSVNTTNSTRELEPTLSWNQYRSLTLKCFMAVAELQPGYEQVFTVTEYYDGPRKGIANFRGQPHFYDCLFDKTRGEYSDLYRLTPIPQRIFELAMEDWTIWKRWEDAFNSGKAAIESHPALSQDRGRHEEIRAILDPVLTTDTAICVTQRGSFEPHGSGQYPAGVIRPLQVKWADAG